MLALGRMVSGLCSVIASLTIIYKVYLLHRQQKNSSGAICSSNNSNNYNNSSNNTNSNSNSFGAPKKVTLYHRLLVGMSVLDVLQSLAAAVGTLAVPASTGVVFGFGTAATCSAQGFFSQLASAIPMYTACLNTYFMLRIRYNVSELVLQTRYEVWFHAIPIGFAVVTSSLGAALKIFNPSALPEIGCWIERYPSDCHLPGKGPCTRGFRIDEWLDWYVWGFCYFWLFASFLVVLVNSIWINAAIRKQERRNATYFAAHLQKRPSVIVAVADPETAARMAAAAATTPPSTDFLPTDRTRKMSEDGSVDESVMMALPQQQQRKHRSGSIIQSLMRQTSSTENGRQKKQKIKASRAAAVQSFLYCTATFFTAIWMFMPWLGAKIGVPTRTSFFFAFMINIIAPSQGVFNLYIFLRLQYNRLRNTEPTWSRRRCLWECLSSPASQT